VGKRFEAKWGGRWGVLLMAGCAADPLSGVAFRDVDEFDLIDILILFLFVGFSRRWIYRSRLKIGKCQAFKSSERTLEHENQHAVYSDLQ
jgi:hypothetical protein